MIKRSPQVKFDGLLTVSVGVGVLTYMLGIFLRPVFVVSFGIGLVVLGTRAFVPRDEQVTAGVLGILTLLLAGVAIPRAVASMTWPIDKLAAAIALSGSLLLLTFVVLRVTVFDSAGPDTA